MPAIPASTRSITYTPVATAGPFPVGNPVFPVFDKDGADLRVTLDGVVVTNWTFVGELDGGFYGAPNTWMNGNVTFDEEVTGTLRIQGRRAPRRTQQYAEGRGVPARDYNTEFNLLTATDQELRRDVDEFIDRLEDLDAAVALADAAADVAVAASGVAVGAASSAAAILGDVVNRTFSTRASVTAIAIAALVTSFSTWGYATVGDGGGGVYVKLGSTPSPVKAWHVQSLDGAYWELREFHVRPKMLGATLNGVANDLAPLQAWVDYSAAFKAVASGSPGIANIPAGTIAFPAGARIDCEKELTLQRDTDVVEPLILASTIDKPSIKGLRFSYGAGCAAGNSAALGAGAVNFTIPAGRGFLVNQYVIVRPTTAPQHYMIARVTAYAGTLLSLNATTVSGTGTFTSWYIQSYTDSSGGGYTPAAVRTDFCTNGDVIDNEIVGKFFIAIGSKNSSRMNIRSNRIVGASDRGVENNSLAGASNVNVDNDISDNDIDGGGWMFYGINSAADGGNQSGLNVRGNQIRDTLVHGVSVGGQIYRPIISDNNIKMYATGVGAFGVGVFVQPLVAQTSIGTVIKGNDLSGGVHGVYVFDAANFVIQGNSIELTGGPGVRVQSNLTHTGSASTINGNSIRNCAGSGIYMDAAVGFSVSGVAITGNGTAANAGWGILTTPNTNGFTITGNVDTASAAGKISAPSTGLAHVVANNN